MLKKIDVMPCVSMEKIAEIPKRRGGRQKVSLELHRKKINLSVSPAIVRALEERVVPGERSRFVERAIAEKLGIDLVPKY